MKGEQGMQKEHKIKRGVLCKRKLTWLNEVAAFHCSPGTDSAFREAVIQ